MKLLQTKSQCAVLTALVCLLSLTVLFSCTKAEESDEQAQIKNKKQSVWTEEDLKPKEGEVTEDGQPVVMIFGATVNYAQKKQQPTEDTDSETQEEEEVDYGALAEKQALAESGDDGVEVKSHLGSLVETLDRKYYPNLWSIGDRVSINGVSTASLPEANITSGGKQARFPMTQWVEQYNGNWYVGYPADAFSYSAGGGIVTLPVKQTYVAGSYDPDAFIMVGKSDEQGLDFYPQVAPLRIVVPGASGTYFSKIRIEAVNGEQLSGTFSTDYNNEDATFTPVSGNSYVEMDTPNLEFGLSSPVFFVLPAITYERGLRIKVTRSSDGKEMVFSNTKSMTVSVGSMTALTSPTFTPTTAQTTPSLVEVTPSSFYVEWASSNPTKDYAKRWQILVYTNSACSGDPTRTIEIYPKTDDLHCWTDGQTPLRFVVGRLNPGATYYVKVRDVGNDNSNSTPASITLSSAPSCVEMPVSNITTTGVALREDFREIGWSAAYYNKKTACGFYPTSSRGSDSVSKREFDYLDTDENTTFYELSDLYGFSYDRMNTAHERSRIAKWLYSGYVYWMPGYIKTGTKNNKGYFFTPAIPLAAGKTAKVSVTIKVSKFDQNTSDTWALAVVSGVVDKWSAGDESEGHNKRLANSFTLPSTSDASLYRTMTFTEDDALLWTERTFDNLYMSNGDRLVFGLPDGAEFGSSKARINIGSVTINVTELTDDIIIRDATSLDAFRGAIAAAVSASESTDITGRVVADFSASTIASTWTPIDGYTGTLAGNGHTITGLTKPFFADLQGTVQNLTLNSTINCTDGSQESTAIFAQYLQGGSMTDCNAIGSVQYCPSTAVTKATRYVAGIVGSVSSGSMTRCTNYASISVPHNDKDNDMIMEVGGVVARLASSTACSYLHNVYDTSIGGTNSGKISVAIHQDYDDSGATDARQCRIGGVIAYVTTGATSISYCTNSGAVEYTGTSYGALKVGGIVGYARRGAGNCQNSGSVTITGAASVTRGQLFLGGLLGHYETNDALTNSNNTGAVSNAAPTTGDDINVGGLVGKCYRSISSCYNSGTVDNSGNSGVDVCIGGIAGNAYKTNDVILTSCYNTNRVRNTGSGGVLAVGGLVGWSGASTSYASTCYNSGAVSNTGQGTNTTAGVRMGGLVGCAAGSNNISGTHYNMGPVTEQSATASLHVAVGGVCGYVDNASTSLASVQNRAGGTVTLSLASKTITKACVGGVLGYAGAACSLSGASNAAAIDAKTTTTADMMYLGGVLGYTASANTLSNISNSGALTINNLTCNTSLYSGGLVGYNGGGTISGTASNGADGDMNITINSSGPSYIGGLAGYSTQAITGKNYGAVVVAGSCSDSLAVGGVVGHQEAANLSSCENHGDVTNSASVTGSAAAELYNIKVGGVAGFICDGSLSSCANDGAVSNSGGSNLMVYVGGVTGRSVSSSSTVTYTSCSNAGHVTNTGTGALSDNNVEAYVGGLVGACLGQHTLTSTSAQFSANTGNRNSGTVTENSGSSHIAIGGVVSYFDHASSDFKYAKNSGRVELTGGSYDMNYVGGVIGVGWTYACVDYSSNSGNIVIKGVTTAQLWCGGVIGQWHESGDAMTTATITGCTNSGIIKTNGTDLTDLVAKGASWTYFGGIIGGGLDDHKNKTYTYCKNTGDIAIYCKAICRVGGIVGTCQLPPNHCEVRANITFRRASNDGGSSSLSHVGGIVGFKQGSGSAAYSYLLYKGTLDALIASGGLNSYAGGMIGNTTQNTTFTFTSCSVGGAIKGRNADPDTGNNAAPRLFVGSTSGSSSRKFTFPDCHVEKNTLYKANSEVTITQNSDITNARCFHKECVLKDGGVLPTVVTSIENENKLQ